MQAGRAKTRLQGRAKVDGAFVLTLAAYTRKVSKPLSGKWQIVEMEVWDKNVLDMFEPAYIVLDGKGSSKFLFACVIAGLDCDDACSMPAIGVKRPLHCRRSQTLPTWALVAHYPERQFRVLCMQSEEL
jgi:hypothetical protein